MKGARKTGINDVGYQALTTPSGFYQDQVSTFKPINGNSVKLSQMIPQANAEGEEITAGNFQLQLVGPGGNPMKVSECEFIAALPNGAEIQSTYGTKEVLLIYYVEPPMDGKPAGWWLSCDKWSTRTKTGLKFPNIGDIEIPHGYGYTCYADATLTQGAKIVYSGEVLNIDQPFIVPSGIYINTGNIAPKPFRIKDFAISAVAEGEEITAGNFQMQLCGSDGNPMKVGDCPFIAALPNGAEIQSTYSTKEVLLIYYVEPPMDGKPAGWWLSCDKWSTRTKTGLKFPNIGDMVIPAGYGFTAYADATLSEGAKIMLPNALK